MTSFKLCQITPAAGNFAAYIELFVIVLSLESENKI